MLSQPVIEFAPIRAPNLGRVAFNVGASSLFHVAPFKSSFCYEEALGQRHHSQCQCIRDCERQI